MPDNAQPDMRNATLDPHLLATPFQVQTHWHVISGTPSCGKTTMIDMLAEVGYQTVLESARQNIERAIAEGSTPEEAKKAILKV